MNQDLLDLALGANRVLTYAGYVLLAGTLTFWSVVWPDGRRNRRLVVLVVAGTAAMIIGTVAGPAIQLVFADKLLGDIETAIGKRAGHEQDTGLGRTGTLRQFRFCRGSSATCRR